MFIVAASCVALLVTNVLVHYEALRLLQRGLAGWEGPRRRKLIAVMLGAFAAHALEIAIYGLALFGLVHLAGAGSLEGVGGASLDNCLYLSAVTYTSLGFGDLVPHGPLRMVVASEGLVGLLLIAWTASYTYLSMERFWSVGN